MSCYSHTRTMCDMFQSYQHKVCRLLCVSVPCVIPVRYRLEITVPIGWVLNTNNQPVRFQSNQYSVRCVMLQSYQHNVSVAPTQCLITRALPCIFRLLCCQAREREAALVYSMPAGRLDWRVPALHACYCRAILVGALTLRILLPAAGRQLTGKKRLLTGLEFKRLNESYNTNQTSTRYLLDYKAKNKLSMHTKHAG